MKRHLHEKVNNKRMKMQQRLVEYKKERGEKGQLQIKIYHFWQQENQLQELYSVALLFRR